MGRYDGPPTTYEGNIHLPLQSEGDANPPSTGMAIILRTTPQTPLAAIAMYYLQ